MDMPDHVQALAAAGLCAANAAVSAELHCLQPEVASMSLVHFSRNSSIGCTKITIGKS